MHNYDIFHFVHVPNKLWVCSGVSASGIGVSKRTGMSSYNKLEWQWLIDESMHIYHYISVAVSITDQICGSGEEFSTLEVTSNQIFIYFESDETLNFDGFALSYSIFPGK